MNTYAIGSRLGQSLVALTLVALGMARESFATESQIYFYAAPIQYPGGEIVASPVADRASQVTTDFPAINEMAGVVLLVYWSTLCPREDACDYSIIEQTLHYWHKRRKHVVLGVSTISAPYVVPETGGRH